MSWKPGPVAKARSAQLDAAEVKFHKYVSEAINDLCEHGNPQSWRWAGPSEDESEPEILESLCGECYPEDRDGTVA